MDKVVYILGAGFSAPLGLPVMSNFFIKSKDMYAENTERFSHFQKVFGLIREMSSIKNFFEADLFNIEEILSVIEMRKRIGSRNKTAVIEYIRDVITYFTPPPFDFSLERPPSNWHDHLIKTHTEWVPYYYFAMSLFGVGIRLVNLDRGYGNVQQQFQVEKLVASPVEYSVITLNYDLVLETVAKVVGESLNGGNKYYFHTDFTKPVKQGCEAVPLVKLHGSIDSGSIIAPTWNKAISDDMRATWKKAHSLLEEANQIRFVGYSLPQADAYIRYLLKSSVISSSHLKNIDVATLGLDGETGDNYKHFIRFKYARYKTIDFQAYCSELRTKTIKNISQGYGSHLVPIKFDQLETVHHTLM